MANAAVIFLQFCVEWYFSGILSLKLVFSLSSSSLVSMALKIGTKSALAFLQLSQ